MWAFIFLNVTYIRSSFYPFCDLWKFIELKKFGLDFPFLGHRIMKTLAFDEDEAVHTLLSLLTKAWGQIPIQAQAQAK